MSKKFILICILFGGLLLSSCNKPKQNANSGSATNSVEQKDTAITRQLTLLPKFSQNSKFLFFAIIVSRMVLKVIIR